MDRAGKLSKTEGFPVTDRELALRQKHADATGRQEPVGTPRYLEEYLYILQTKHSEYDFEEIDIKRYARILSGMSPDQADLLTQTIDETFRYRPDVSQVVEVKARLFPSLAKDHLKNLPPAIAAAYTDIRGHPYYDPNQPVDFQQGLIEGTGIVSEGNAAKWRELVSSLERRMSPDERRQAGALREERIKAAKGKKGKGDMTGRDVIINDDAARRKLAALRAQTELLQKEAGSDIHNHNGIHGEAEAAPGGSSEGE